MTFSSASFSQDSFSPLSFLLTETVPPASPAFSDTSFSTSSFSVNAFSFGEGVIPPEPDEDDFQILGGGIGYDDDDIERLRRQYAERAQQLQAVEAKILSEKQNLEKIQKMPDNAIRVDGFEAAQADALYLAAVAQAQIEIKRLQSMKAALMRMLDEEEAILVILLSHPFYH